MAFATEQQHSGWYHRLAAYEIYPGAGLVRFQCVLLAVALSLSAVQWLLVGYPSLVVTLIYTFCSGNVTTILLGAATPLYHQPFPRNWIVYLSLLIPVSFISSAVGALLKNLALGLPLATLQNWRTSDIPYAALICFITGACIYVFASNRIRMEHANQQLAQQVQYGRQELATQASDLQDAFEIQASLLPRTIPQIPGVQISCAWQPARTVSGDYFDVIVLSDSRIAFCLADVSGKGMSAALITANLQATLRAFASDETSPAHLCHRLNQALCGSLPTGRFVTLAYGIVDRKRMTLTYELAGHNAPILLRGAPGDTQSILLQGTGPVLGILSGASYQDQTVSLLPGDRLLVSTDGVTEAFDPSGEEWGEDRMVEAATLSGPSAHTIRTGVMAAVTLFARNHFHDDASLVVVQMQS